MCATNHAISFTLLNSGEADGAVWGDDMYSVVHKRSQSRGDYYCVYDAGRLVFRTSDSRAAREWLKRNPGYVEPPPRPAVCRMRVA